MVGGNRLVGEILLWLDWPQREELIFSSVTATIIAWRSARSLKRGIKTLLLCNNNGSGFVNKKIADLICSSKGKATSNCIVSGLWSGSKTDIIFIDDIQSLVHFEVVGKITFREGLHLAFTVVKEKTWQITYKLRGWYKFVSCIWNYLWLQEWRILLFHPCQSPFMFHAGTMHPLLSSRFLVQHITRVSCKKSLIIFQWLVDIGRRTGGRLRANKI